MASPTSQCDPVRQVGLRAAASESAGVLGWRNALRLALYVCFVVAAGISVGVVGAFLLGQATEVPDALLAKQHHRHGLDKVMARFFVPDLRVPPGLRSARSRGVYANEVRLQPLVAETHDKASAVGSGLDVSASAVATPIRESPPEPYMIPTPSRTPGSNWDDPINHEVLPARPREQDQIMLDADEEHSEKISSLDSPLEEFPINERSKETNEYEGDVSSDRAIDERKEESPDITEQQTPSSHESDAGTKVQGPVEVTPVDPENLKRGGMFGICTSVVVFFSSLMERWRRHRFRVHVPSIAVGMASPEAPQTEALPNKALERLGLRYRLRATWTDLASLFVLVLPTVATLLASPLLSMVDSAVVGRTASKASGGVELAALGAATLACDYPGYVFTSALSATTIVLTAKHRSQEGRVASESIAKTGGYISLLVGLLYGAATCVGTVPMLRLLVPQHNHKLLIAPAATYVRLRMLATPFMMLGSVLQAWFLGRQDTITPLVATVVAALVNLVMDVFLCVKCNMGLAGAAWATSLSQVVSCAALVWSFTRKARTDVKEDPAGSPDEAGLEAPANVHLMKEFCAMSLPTAGVVTLKMFLYGGLAAAATHLGVAPGAAYMLMSNVFFFFAVFGDAISSVAQTVMPAHLPPLGSFYEAKRWAKLMSTCGLCVGVLTGVVSAMLTAAGGGLFTKDVAVLKGMIVSTPFTACALVLYALSMASEGIIFASQSMRFMAGSYALNSGLALLGLYAAVRSGLSLSSIWLINVQFQLVRILLNGGLLLSPWTPLNRKDPDPYATETAQ